MIVKDLIEALKKLPPDAEVYKEYYCEGLDDDGMPYFSTVYGPTYHLEEGPYPLCKKNVVVL